MPTLDEYWNTEEWHERSYDMQLKYVLHDWGAAERKLKREWLAKLRAEQQKSKLLYAILKRFAVNPAYTMAVSIMELMDDSNEALPTAGH